MHPLRTYVSTDMERTNKCDFVIQACAVTCTIHDSNYILKTTADISQKSHKKSSQK